MANSNHDIQISYHILPEMIPISLGVTVDVDLDLDNR